MRTPSEVVVPTRLPAPMRMWVISRVTVDLPLVPEIEMAGIRRSASRIQGGGVVRAAVILSVQRASNRSCAPVSLAVRDGETSRSARASAASWIASGVSGAVLSAAAMTALNYAGIKPASVFQGVTVLFLLAAGATMLTGSFVGGSASNMEPLFTGGVSGMFVVLVAVPFLFVGFDVIPQSASEIKLPHRLVGTLLVVSVFCATAWYAMVMLTAGAGMSPADLLTSELASADSMAAMWNSAAMGNLLVLGGIAGLLTSWNAFLIGGSRLIYAMARSRMLPAWFGELHPRFHTPANAVLFIGALSALAPFFGRPMLVWLVNAGGFNIVVAFLMVVVSFLVLRRREPEMERPFKVRAGVPVGVTAFVLAFGLFLLYLPGMPAALGWPNEWSMVLVWWLGGAALMLRLPGVSPGPDAEQRLIDVMDARSGSRGAPTP